MMVPVLVHGVHGMSGFLLQLVGYVWTRMLQVPTEMELLEVPILTNETKQLWVLYGCLPTKITLGALN